MMVRKCWFYISFRVTSRSLLASVTLLVCCLCNIVTLTLFKPTPIAQLVECPLRGTGGHGFDPGPRHTEVVKNGTSCSSLSTQTYGVKLGLVDPVSG